MSIDEQRTIYEGYIHMKMADRDWHAVADAAMDLRELELKQQFEQQIVRDLKRDAGLEA